MSSRYIFSFLFFTYIVWQGLLFADKNIRSQNDIHTKILQKSSDHLKLHIKLPLPEIKSTVTGEVASYKSAHMQPSADGALLPVISKMIPLPNGQVQYSVSNHKYMEVPILDYAYAKTNAPQTKNIELK